MEERDRTHKGLEYAPADDPRPRDVIVKHRMARFAEEMKADSDPLPQEAQVLLTSRYRDQLDIAPTLTKNYPAHLVKSDYEKMRHDLIFSVEVRELESEHELDYPNTGAKMID